MRETKAMGSRRFIAKRAYSPRMRAGLPGIPRYKHQSTPGSQACQSSETEFSENLFQAQRPPFASLACAAGSQGVTTQRRQDAKESEDRNASALATLRLRVEFDCVELI
jgi:hypothetical protein